MRGRSGRQGDPGESRFYLSLGDDLMRLFNAAMVESFLTRFNIPEDVPIESKMVTNAIRSAQTQVEAQNFEIRKNVLKYDEVLNRQRSVIYDERRRVLHGEDLQDQVSHMIDDVVEGYVRAATAEGYAEQWDLEQLWTALRTLFPLSLTIGELEDEVGGRSALTPDFLVAELVADAQEAYAAREEQLGHDAMRELERRVVLSVLDRKWREHLYEMDYLKEGIGLRAMAQRDPLVEFQREGFALFSAMMDAIKEESVGYLFNLEVSAAEPDRAARESAASGSAAEPATAPASPEPATASAPAASSAPSDGDVAKPPRPLLVAKGLVAPRRTALQYSAPTVDGHVATSDGSHTDGAAEEDSDGGSRNGAAGVGEPPANRAQRRRAGKAARKRR